MTEMTNRPRREGALILGGILIAVGLLAASLTYLDVDPTQWLEGSGWTLFILVPGLILLAAGLLTTQPAAEGMTIGGAVVTSLAVMMLVMDRTGTWETWAYAWALIPAAAGCGLVLHGMRRGIRSAIDKGLRLVAASLVMMLIGGWYFGTLFATGEPPIDVGDAWPLVLVVVGAIVLVVGWLVPGRDRETTTPA